MIENGVILIQTRNNLSLLWYLFEPFIRYLHSDKILYLRLDNNATHFFSFIL